MNVIKRFSAAFVIALTAGVILSTNQVSAAPAVNFGNVNNLPIGQVTTLEVSATGLAPNTDVLFLQCTGTGSLCSVPGCPQPQSGCEAQIYTTDASGNFTAPVPVSYDFAQYYADQFNNPAFGVCEIASNPLQVCYLQLIDLESGEVVGQTNLHFGNAVTPPAGPLTKDDCKGTKWNTYSTLGFKNQGACISYVNRAS